MQYNITRSLRNWMLYFLMFLSVPAMGQSLNLFPSVRSLGEKDSALVAQRQAEWIPDTLITPGGEPESAAPAIAWSVSLPDKAIREASYWLGRYVSLLSPERFMLWMSPVRVSQDSTTPIKPWYRDTVPAIEPGRKI